MSKIYPCIAVSWVDIPHPPLFPTPCNAYTLSGARRGKARRGGAAGQGATAIERVYEGFTAIERVYGGSTAIERVYEGFTAIERVYRAPQR